MRQQLIQYVNLLFAGAPDSDDIKQEILQNTLDRYDDLISQGKSPEAAYRLAISGIGDINEILGNPAPTFREEAKHTYVDPMQEEADDTERRKVKAAAIAMYILCPVPLFILSEIGYGTIGLCLMLALVAAATALIIMYRTKDDAKPVRTETVSRPQAELKEAVGNVIWCITVALYFVISFLSHAWYITWVIFPLCGCIQGLVNAIIDLREANKYEV